MKILIADDNKYIVEDLKEELSELLPDAFCVGTAESDEILPLFEKHCFDIVFMDIEMPKANGIQLAKEILEIRPKTNIIYITAHTKYALEGFKTYASAFLEKPVSTKMLADALAHLRYPVSNITEEMIEREYSDKAVIGRQIEKWREERGMSRQELADTLEVDVRTVYRWENAEHSPDIATYMKILRTLGRDRDII